MSTNASSTNLFVIACDSDWNGADEWTNAADMYPPGRLHRGDGNTNSTVQQSPATACYQNRSDQFIVAYYDSTGLPGGPPGANDQTNWAEYAESQVWYCVLPGSPFWPNRDANGQALIHLQAGQMYYMQLEHVQNGGGYDEGVTCKIAGAAGSVFTVSVRSNRRQHCRFRAVQANHLHRRSRRWAANYLHGRFARRNDPFNHHQPGGHLVEWPVAIQPVQHQEQHQEQHQDQPVLSNK